jgi:hypothetical protein
MIGRALPVRRECQPFREVFGFGDMTIGAGASLPPRFLTRLSTRSETGSVSAGLELLH